MSKKQKRGVPEINAGSMADIAFLLLIFFIVATTMDVDSGILTQLPPMPPDEEQPPPPDINERNVLTVLVNSRDQLLVEGEWTDVTQLRAQTKEFILNPQGKMDLPESPTKAVVSLQNDRGTSYNAYIQVQNELKAAYNEVRNEESRKKYGKKYDDLNPDQQKDIKAMYPVKISEAEPKDIGAK
ncbi:MAG: Biopolymer transport protein ExbD/TolR [Bacteroidetes bacterium ADurb.Bin397]|jgi:biopolymer transport protein ExbD|nr:MAG: Biopolymer transport protein ExbD/TolR [Bacteroidetes bacterium ADurb.Bin397]